MNVSNLDLFQKDYKYQFRQIYGKHIMDLIFLKVEINECLLKRFQIKSKS